MPWAWIAGYLFAIALIALGTLKKTRIRVSSRQVFIGVGFLMVIAVTAMMLDAQYQWLEKIPAVSLAILGCLILVYRIANTARHKLRAGAVLLDLGRVPMGEFLIEIVVAAALVADAVISGARAMRLSAWTIGDISFEILELSVALVVFAQGILKRSVSQGGVFQGTTLIPWAKIESYTWEAEGRGSRTLVLHRQSWIALLKATSLSVSANRVDAVSDVLHQRGIVAVGQPQANEEKKT
jgi:hypothetical protein